MNETSSRSATAPANGLRPWDFGVIAAVTVGCIGCLLSASELGTGLAGGLVLLGALYFRMGRGSSNAEVGNHTNDTHELLMEIVEYTPMPFAVYDENDRLIAWNSAYERLHAVAFQALSAKAQSRQVRYADLMGVVAEQMLPPSEREAYVRSRVQAQRQTQGASEDRFYPDIGWRRVLKFITPSGMVAGFAIDIDELKERETALREQIEQSKRLEDRLRVIANTDPLTELPNRRSLFERCESEFSRATRYENTFSVIMMDIDNFKTVNDSYGHDVGDGVIVRVALTAAAQLRTNVDVIGRVGGEEFAILLPHTNLVGGCHCAERVRQAIATLYFKAAPDLKTTSSFGVAELISSDQTFSTVFNRADQALYRAKDNGRNQVCSWEQS